MPLIHITSLHHKVCYGNSTGYDHFFCFRLETKILIDTHKKRRSATRNQLIANEIKPFPASTNGCCCNIVINGIMNQMQYFRRHSRNPFVSDAVCVGPYSFGQGTITQVNFQRLKTLQLDGIRIFWRMAFEWVGGVLFLESGTTIFLASTCQPHPRKSLLKHGI